jgi:uncharacterized C2H2 Zn-finger protein
MSGNAYHRIARLGTHPAFSMRAVALVCPCCGQEFQRVGEYTRHYIGHRPPVEEARSWLDWRAFERYARSHASTHSPESSTHD